MGAMSFFLQNPTSSSANLYLALVIYPKSMMKDWKERKPSIVFECDDVFGTYEAMKEKGVEFMGEPQKMTWGTFVQFKDDDGNEFVLKG